MKPLTPFLGFSLLFLAYSASYGQGGSTTPGAGATDNLYKSSEVTLKAHVNKKPEPKYTKAARKNQIEGTVVLRCIFSKTGEVTNIHVVSGLPDGLTDRAVEAAKKIRFTPATKDGHSVSMWMELQYNFHLR